MIVKIFKRSRENLELTQDDIEKLLGLHFSTISGWECGKDIIPIRQLIKYANHFNFSLDYLFGITTYNTIDYEPIIIDLKVISKNLRLLRKQNNMT